MAVYIKEKPYQTPVENDRVYSLGKGLFLLLAVNECKRQVAFAAQLAVHFERSFGEEDHTSSACELCRDLAEVTGADNVLETDIVDAAVERCAAFQLVFHKQGAALGHDFTLDDSGHYRIAREMSPAEEFIFLDPVFRMRNSFCIDFDFIDQKHRLAVRQVFFKFFSVHFDRYFGIRFQYLAWLLFHFSECNTTIVASEAERVGYRDGEIDLFRLVWSIVEVTFRIRSIEIDGRRYNPVGEGED